MGFECSQSQSRFPYFIQIVTVRYFLSNLINFSNIKVNSMVTVKTFFHVISRDCLYSS